MARTSRKNNVTEPVKATVYIKTALYVRLSVEDNKNRGCSIENQQLVLNDFLADKPEFEVYNTYIDNGLSGRDFNRPAFRRMIEDIEAGFINCVIVKDLSRLGRNAIDTGYYVEYFFPTHKIRFIAVTDQYDTADESGAHNGVMLPLKNMINEAYALDIGRKIRAQAHQAMKDGDYIGARPPFGYKKAPNNCHKLLIDEETAPIVRQIFQWAADGIGVNPIAKRLNEMNAVTSSVHKSLTSEVDKNYKKNVVWTAIGVTRILDNPVYTGDMVQGKSKMIDHKQYKTNPAEYIIVKNTHDAIVSHEMYEKAKAIRENIRDEYRGKKTVPYTENIFKGKIFCHHCGRSLHRQRHRKRYYFHCLSNDRIAKGTCLGIRIDEEELIGTVKSILEKELSAALGMSLSELQSEDNLKTEVESIKSEIAEKQRDISKYQGLAKGLYESLINGIIATDECNEMKAAYEKKISDINAEIAELKGKIDKAVKDKNKRKELKRDAKEIKKGTLTADLINRLIERIEVTHDKDVHIVFKFTEHQGKAAE